MTTFTIAPDSGAVVQTLAGVLKEAQPGDVIVVPNDQWHDLATRGARRLGVKGVTIRIDGEERAS